MHHTYNSFNYLILSSGLLCCRWFLRRYEIVIGRKTKHTWNPTYTHGGVTRDSIYIRNFNFIVHIYRKFAVYLCCSHVQLFALFDYSLSLTTRSQYHLAGFSYCHSHTSVLKPLYSNLFVLFIAHDCMYDLLYRSNSSNITQCEWLYLSSYVCVCVCLFGVRMNVWYLCNVMYANCVHLC